MNEAPRWLPVSVEGDQLHQRHPDPVGETAVDLALDDRRVDPHAAVVHRDEPAHGDLPRAGVDLDHAHVGPARERQVGRVVDGHRVQMALDAVRQLQVGVRGHGDLPARRPRPRHTAHLEAPRDPLEVLAAPPPASPPRPAAPAPAPCAPPPPPPRRTPASTATRRCRGRTACGRCRPARPPPRPRRCPARARRAARTSSRGPGPATCTTPRAPPSPSGARAAARRRPCPTRRCPSTPAARRRRPR